AAAAGRGHARSHRRRARPGHRGQHRLIQMLHRLPNGNLRGIAAMLIAVAVFAFMDAVLKAMSARYPVLQIVALRGLTALPLILLYIGWRGSWAPVLRMRWPLHLLRGVLGIVMLSLFTLGVRSLPLSAAYTLFFIAPLLVTVLAVPVLKERVPRAHAWA